jgi:MoaA/NifB/PqqE/SkfB family radical SAM enzyme
MYKYEEIKSVHLELTERCQAACPMCARTDNPHMKNNELSLADIKKIFPIIFLKQLDFITICGNFGEPIVARDFLSIVDYFKSVNYKIGLHINTNAGARDDVFWEELALILDDGKSTVNFGIDGLKDTNHIYRVNVKWDRLMNSAKTFIRNGGHANWDYLIFDHNKHQLIEAEKLSRQLGFKSFRPKKTSRFATQSNYTIPEHIKQPTEYVNEAGKNYSNLTNENFFDEVPISCKVKNKKQIYISAEGLLLPCCWIGQRLYSKTNKDYKDDQVWDYIQDRSKIDAKIYSIKEIMETDFLENIEKSWTINSIKQGKLKTCAITCNINFDLFGSQFT